MAKTKEQKARESFKDKCVGRILLIPVENQAETGTPDSKGINRKGVSFWLEFKALDNWPARDSTKPLKGRFERGQVPFLKQWISWRGIGFVVLRVRDEFYLFNPKQQEIELVDMNKNELIGTAIQIGANNIIKHLEELN